MMKRLLFLIFLIFYNLQAKEINIYINAHIDKKSTIERWQPTVDLLNKKLPEHSFKILPIPPKKISKIKTLLSEKKIDLLITQAAITTELEFSNNISVMLTMANKHHMDKFGSVFIVKNDNKSINNIEDIKGKSIAAVAPLGLGGWLIGYNELYDYGIDPIADKKVSFLGSQKKIVQSILNKNYEVGVIRTGMLENLHKKFNLDISKLKIINEKELNYPIRISTKLFPEWSLSKAEHLEAHLTNRIFKVFAEIRHTDVEAIRGQYYDWHLPVSHKDIDLLFKRFGLGHYKDMPKYDLDFVIISSLISAIVIALLSFLLLLYLRYKDSKKIREKLIKDVKSKNKKIDELHKRLFYAADQVLAGYWEWNLEDNSLYLSRGWKEFLGYEENELKNHFETFNLLVHPEDFEPTMKIVNEYLDGKINSYKASFRLKHKNGEYKWVTAIGAIADNEADKNKIFFGFHIDINEFVNIKEMLISQSKSAMMGEMIGIIAHQFKQPLSVLSIVASNQIISVEFDEKISNDEIKKSATEVQNQVQYLSETIDIFRSFLNPTQSKLFCHIDDVVKSSFRILSKNLKNKNIEIITDFKNSSEININKSELMQAIINILNNSKDAFEINSIEDRKIFIKTYDYDEKVILEIEDTAGGIPSEKLEKIFDAYFTTKDKYNGTGLGLHIVKIIVTEHFDGQIEVENTSNGLKTVISLPIVNNS